MTFYARGRLAVASIESERARRDARVAVARRMARRLEREHDPWTGVLASALRAAASNALGDRDGAIAALRETLRRAEATDTIALAVPARYRLGELLGGAAGDALTKAAGDELIAEGIRNPARWAAIFIPGRWSGAG
jgi:eukaryotic-like serine/threonine-protein kinase